MIEYLIRNDVKVSIADSPVTADGKTLPAGAAVVSMYQAKRSVANAALYREPLITSWETMSNGASGSFNYIRGFDMVTCVKPAEYRAIADALGRTITYDTLQPFMQENAVSQFTGEEGGDVIISNASESSTAAVNALLGAGKQVAMITEGEYKGYFTALPEGSKILVQRDGSRDPLEGVFHGEDESTDAFLNGIMGFSYEGKDKDGNEVNITLFANSMTESGHQRDEYAFISNALFARFLTDTPYVTTAATTGSN